MELEEYREESIFEVECPSGMTFKLREFPMTNYDNLIQFLEDKDINPENPKEGVIRKYAGELQKMLFPPSSVEPVIRKNGEEIEDKSKELAIEEIQPVDSIKLLKEIMDRMGVVGKKARKMQNFRGEESSS